MNRENSNRAAWARAIGAFIVAMIYHGVTLTSLPLWFVDEAVTASRVEAMLETGRADGSLDRYVIEEGASSERYVATFPYFLFSIPIKYLGLDLSIGSLRVTALGSIAFLLIGVGLISWRSLGPHAAALGILFAGFSRSLPHGHIARPDIIAAGLGYLALGLYRPRSKELFVAGFVIALACAAHLRAVILLSALLAVVFWDLYSKQLTWRNIFFGALGLSFGGLIFYIVNILPYSHSDAFRRSHAVVAQYSAPAALTFDWNFWIATIRSMGDAIAALYPDFGMVILLGAILMAITARTTSEKRLWILIWVSLVAGLFLILGMLPIKLLIITPSIDLAATAIFYRIYLYAGFRDSLVVWRTRVLSVVTAFYIASNIYFPVPPAYCEEEFRPLQQWLTKNVSVNSVIMGQEVYWMHLRDHPFVSWKLLSYYAAARRETLGAAFKHFGADYFIFDHGVDVFLKDGQFSDPFFDSMDVPRSEFMAYLAKQGEIIDRRKTSCHGDIVLIKLR